MLTKLEAPLRRTEKKRKRERERRKRRSSHPWEDRMKGEKRGGKVEVEKRGGGWSGPSHSFMEIKDVISVPARTSLILSLYSVFLFPFLPLEARTSLPARHFLHATLAVDAANCKLISPLHFATRDRRPRHRSIFRVSKRVESLREKYKSKRRFLFFMIVNRLWKNSSTRPIEN